MAIHSVFIGRLSLSLMFPDNCITHDFSIYLLDGDYLTTLAGDGNISSGTPFSNRNMVVGKRIAKKKHK